MFLVYLHNDSIQKEHSGFLVKEITQESIQKVIDQWDWFNEVKLRVQGNHSDDFSFYHYTSPVFKEYLSWHVVDEFNYLVREYEDQAKLYPFIAEIQDDEFTEYKIGIDEYKFLVEIDLDRYFR